MNKMALFLAFFLLPATPALAQMHHYTVGTLAPAAEQKPEAAAPQASDDDNAYGGGSFIVTPVQDCFSKLKPGEAVEIRKNFPNPYEECQARLKQRAEEKKKAEDAAKLKPK